MARDDEGATIAIVGIDGAGKTTQAVRLAQWLTEMGFPARYRLAASGRRVMGNAARRIGHTDSVSLLGPRLAIRTETWLRHANLKALRRDRLSVADRYDVCQFARARVVCPEMEPWVRKRLGRVPRADVMFYLTVAPAAAHQRVRWRGVDDETTDKLTALDQAYRSLPEAENFVFIDAEQNPDKVTAQVRDQVRSALPQLFEDRHN